MRKSKSRKERKMIVSVRSALHLQNYTIKRLHRHNSSTRVSSKHTNSLKPLATALTNDYQEVI